MVRRRLIARDILMRRVAGLVFIACVLVGLSAQAGAKTRSPQEEIQPLLDEMQVAANAHDTDRFLALLQRGPGLTFVFNGTVIQGWDSLREHQLKWWLNGKSDVVYTLNGKSEFQVLSPTIVAVTQTETSTRTLPNGETGKNEFAISMIWQKLPEGWRVVYDHESTVH
jgi:SnoaL-like domain